jgi:cysteine synthase
MIKSLSNLCKHYNIDGKIIVYRPYKSKKQLLANWVIKQALKNGELTEGQAVAEITAGNFGIALAEQCQNLNRKLFLVPIGQFNRHITDKLARFDNVTLVNPKQQRNIACIKETLEFVILQTNAYSFRQFDNISQIDFYKKLLKNKLNDIKIDAVFEKVGTGATMQAVKETIKESSPHAQYYIAVPDSRKIETSHLILSMDGVEQTHPYDIYEYQNNFEKILKETENLKNINYAKLSLFCAMEWLKNNPHKTAFVFVGD